MSSRTLTKNLEEHHIFSTVTSQGRALLELTSRRQHKSLLFCAWLYLLFCCFNIHQSLTVTDSHIKYESWKPISSYSGESVSTSDPENTNEPVSRWMGSNDRFLSRFCISQDGNSILYLTWEIWRLGTEIFLSYSHKSWCVWHHVLPR